MNYEFPEIYHLNDVLKAIEGRQEFIVADRGDHVIVNYNVNFEDTFPPILANTSKETQILMALRRECRGLIFSKKTGEVLARRLHKFFNVGERAETEIRNIDITKSHVILEKLDGSMVTPYMTGEEIRWGTKMGLTDTAVNAEEFTRKHPKYADFAGVVMKAGKTPTFEWMSRKNRIVVDYKHENLVLTAIRGNVNGLYDVYHEMKKLADSYGVDIVRALPGSVENLEKFMAEVNDLEGAEGYVIRFADGHMVKIKGAWYVGLHKTKDALSREKNVIGLVLNHAIDDAKSFSSPEDSAKMDEFQRDFWAGVDSSAAKIQKQVDDAKAEIAKVDMSAFENPEAEQRKLFARDYVSGYPKFEQGLMFQVHSGMDAKEAVVAHIKKKLSSQTKVDNMRSLFGVTWNDYYVEAEG